MTEQWATYCQEHEREMKENMVCINANAFQMGMWFSADGVSLQ